MQSLNQKEMKCLSVFLLAMFFASSGLKAQSNLLESVKRNPEEARKLCTQFRNLNAKGLSVSSKEAISEVSRKRNLSQIDAEILSIYVIGLHCPDVQ